MRTQLETLNSAPEFAMQSRHSLIATFALGIGALHSTTGLWPDYKVGGGRVVGPLGCDFQPLEADEIVIAHNLMDVPRTELNDHSVTVVPSHALERLAGQVISNMVHAMFNLEDTRKQTEILLRHLYVENV